MIECNLYPGIDPDEWEQDKNMLRRLADVVFEDTMPDDWIEL